MTTETEKIQRPDFSGWHAIASVTIFIVALLIVWRLILGLCLDMQVIDTEKATAFWNAGCKAIAVLAVAFNALALDDALPRLLGKAAKAKNDAKESEA